MVDGFPYHRALYVALIQTASALPFFLFALPAGAIGDIVDRRRLILYTETWMVAIAFVLAVLTLIGLISPLLLLILTFALSAGDAFEIIVSSWAEHLRQHERFTRADRKVEERVQRFIKVEPKVWHLISVETPLARNPTLNDNTE